MFHNSEFSYPQSPVEMDELARIVPAACQTLLDALPEGATRDEMTAVCPCLFKYDVRECPEKRNRRNPTIRIPFSR